MTTEKKDHRWYTFVVEGKTIARTFVSTGSKVTTLSDDLISSMAKQLNVSTPFFDGLVSCTKDLEDYVVVLRQKDVL